MFRIQNPSTRSALFGLLAAPAVPAVAALLAFSSNRAAIPMAGLVYGVAALVTVLVGVPAFLLLRKRNLVTWWSATFVGALPSSIALAAVGHAEAMSFFAFAALGGLSGFVFWLVWRIGNPEHQTNLIESREPRVSSRNPNTYALFGLVLFFAAWGGSYGLSLQKMNFDAEAWQKNVHDPRFMSATPRQLMADGFMRKNALLGKTRAEVETLLGPDSDSSYFRDYDLVYWLGPERGLVSIDSEWLVIKFANDGRVAEARLVTD